MPLQGPRGSEDLRCGLLSIAQGRGGRPTRASHKAEAKAYGAAYYASHRAEEKAYVGLPSITQGRGEGLRCGPLRL